MKNIKIAILHFVVILITLFNGNVLDAAGKTDGLINKLESGSYDTRLSGLITLNSMLDKKEIVLEGDLKKASYRVVQEVIDKKVTIDTSEDDEGLYWWEVMKLAARTDDIAFLPYLLDHIPAKPAIEAVVRHGDVALGKYIETIKLKKDIKERQSAVFKLRKIIENRKAEKGFSDKVKIKMRDKVTEIIEHSLKLEYSKNKKAKDLADLKLEVLRFYDLLKDDTVLPVIRKIAESDNYYEMIPEKYLRYRAMDSEERKRHRDELEKITEHEGKTKGMAANAVKKEVKVRYYPVREKAEKLRKKMENK